MQYQVFSREEQVGQAAATLFAAQLLRKPTTVFGFATGSTPIPMYRQLVRWYEEGVLDFSYAHSFNLDEYCGLPADHPQSYHYFMRENLFGGINMPAAHIHVPNGNPKQQDDAGWAAEGEAYDMAIAEAGGIDIQLLSIGANGHIGFNEPDEVFIRDTHRIKLTQATIDSNVRFFDSEDEMPKTALTMGIGSIMRAREIVMVITGPNKADIVHQMMHSEINPKIPATILHAHPNVRVLLDEAAASKL